MGLTSLLYAPPLILVGMVGFLFLMHYANMKKNRKILTIGGTKIHYVIDNNKETPKQALVNVVTSASTENLKIENKPIVDTDVEKQIQPTSKVFKKDNSNILSLMALLTAIIAWPLLFTVVFWIPFIISSFVFSIIILSKKSKGIAFAIISIILNFLFIFVFIALLMS